jgi:hypothetical protein
MKKPQQGNESPSVASVLKSLVGLHTHLGKISVVLKVYQNNALPGMKMSINSIGADVQIFCTAGTAVN